MRIDLKQIADRVARAVAGAGDTPWLVGYDANAIQEFIAASGRLISMRGASEAILRFDQEVNAHELSIFAGGGRGVLLTRSREDAVRRERALVERYRAVTHGGVIATCAVPLELGGEAEAKSIRWLRHRLDIAKDAAPPPGGALPDGKESECVYCRQYLARHQRMRDDQPEMVCAQCNAMLDEGRNAGRERGEPLGEMSLSIAEIATDGWIATISADGNNLGAMFDSLGTLVELAVVSAAVAATFRSAHERALDPIPEDQRLPLMTGGDDVRAFLPPRAVLGYVEKLVEAVESEAAGHARAARSLISQEIAKHLGGLGIGIGAVIANVYYPAQRLIAYAHELEDSAKAACREHKWRSGFDFAIVTAEDAMTERPVRTLHPGAVRPLPPCTDRWRTALRNARALARIPSAQLAILAAVPTVSDEHSNMRRDPAKPSHDSRAGDEEPELGNVLRYQVARSEEWRAWYTECGVDWRDRAAVFAHRPTRDAIELVRLLGFGGPS